MTGENQKPMNLYEILDVDRESSKADIKRAYRSLSQVCHPDKGGDVDAFQALQHAYDVLKDPERRAKYDATGNTEPQPDVEQAARSELVALFSHLFEQNDHMPFDYIGAAQDILSGSLADHKGTLQKTKAKAPRVQKLIDGFDNDLIVAGLNQKLENLNREIEGTQQGIDMHIKCLELLIDIKYTGEMPEPAYTPYQNPFEVGIIFR